MREATKKVKGPNAPEPTDEEMMASFKAYDTDGCGHVTKKDMTAYLLKAFNHAPEEPEKDGKEFGDKQ